MNFDATDPMPPHPTYAMLLLDARAAFFFNANTGWQPEKIDGEEWTTFNSHGEIASLIGKLSERIHGECQLADIELTVIYPQAAVKVLKEVPQALLGLHCTCWQIVRWEPLADRASALQANDDDPYALPWITDVLLPVADSMFRRYSEERGQLERARLIHDHEATVEQINAEKEHIFQDKLRLQNERDRLESERAALQVRLASMQTLDLEQLVAFLPIIYRNFWSTVSPADLALIAGRTSAPNIPSPHPEPSTDTVALMKRRLYCLPASEQERLRTFCQQLPHKLEKRSELRNFLEG